MQYTRFTLFHALWLAAVGLFVVIGIRVGEQLFGTVGLVAGGIIGFIVGHILGCLPSSIAMKKLYERLDRSTNSELRSMVAADDWKFGHTLALLQLAARGEEVKSELPRILDMLVSESQDTRMFGWDALRLVFPKETEVVEDYDPKESIDRCRTIVARLPVSEENQPGFIESR